MGDQVGLNNRDQLSTVQYLRRTPGLLQSRECSLTLTTHLNSSADHKQIIPPQAVQNIALSRDNECWPWLVPDLVITILDISY